MAFNVTNTGGATFPTTSPGGVDPYEPAVLKTHTEGNIHIPAVHINSGLPTTAFGELSNAENTPQAQFKFPYGLNSDVDQILTNKAASQVTFPGSVATIKCAGVAEAFSQIRSLDTIRYGPGQGAEFRGTAYFDAGAALSSQRLGAGDDDEGFFFAMDGVDFGIAHCSHGSLEIKTLEITAGADGNGGTFTITLDDTPVTVTVAGNDSIATVCRKIVALTDEFGDAGRGWEVHTDDNVSVEFISMVAETAGGTFSFADVDSGVTAGAFSIGVAGVAPTVDNIPQTDWNIDPMDGTGPSGVTLGFGVTPSDTGLALENLNVYKIPFQFLGAGMVPFYVELPTGGWNLVHVIRRAGTSKLALLSNPTLHLTCIVKTEAGYAGGALTMGTASAAGFIQGKETAFADRHGVSNSKSTTGTTPVNILTLHNDLDFNSVRNKMTVFLDFITIASLGGNKTVEITVLHNVTEIGGTVSLAPVQSANSPMEYDTAGTTIVGGQELMNFNLGAGESKNINLKDFNVHLRPGDRITFAGNLNAPGTDSTVSVGASFRERL